MTHLPPHTAITLEAFCDNGVTTPAANDPSVDAGLAKGVYEKMCQVRFNADYTT